MKVVGEITPDREFSARVTKHVSEPGNETVEWVETPPELGHRDLVALRVKGNALYPFMPDGTLIYYSETATQPPFDAHLDALCIVKTKHGPAVIRKLRRGELFDTYHLEDFFGDKLQNVEVEWCARITFIKLP